MDVDSVSSPLYVYYFKWTYMLLFIYVSSSGGIKEKNNNMAKKQEKKRDMYYHILFYAHMHTLWRLDFHTNQLKTKSTLILLPLQMHLFIYVYSIFKKKTVNTIKCILSTFIWITQLNCFYFDKNFLCGKYL